MDKAAYIISQAVSALSEIEAMKAANREREAQAHSPAYTDEDFFNVQEKFCIGHNAVIGHLYDR